jgi:hypothetical protein
MTKYYCNYCTFRTIRKFRLDTHLKNNHTDLITNKNENISIILIFIQHFNNNNILKSIESFFKNFVNLDLIKHKICILKNKKYKGNIKSFDEFIYYDKYNFCFDNILGIIKKYDYLIFMNDTYNLNNEINIIRSYDIFFKNINYKQLLLLPNNLNHQNMFYYDKVYSKSIFIDINHEDLYYIHKNIDIRPEKNTFKNNYITINHLDYLGEKYVNWPYFKLEPSIIKTDIFNKINLSLNTNLYLQRNFSYDFYKNNFTSININNKIFSENTNKVDKKNWGKMTIVTGFIYINKDEGFKKHKYNYIEKSKNTLELKNFMYIYISQNLYDHVYNFRKKLGLENKTKIIIVEEKDLYLYDQVEKIRKNTQKNIPTYQNPLYNMAVNSRYKFMEKCINENPFNSDYFAWIDFSAGHIVNFPKNKTISYNKKNKIRLAWIGRCKIEKKKMFYHHRAMGGGVFAGHKDIMLEFIKLHDSYFKRFMNYGYNINDDKLLFFMFEKQPELFDYYFSSYHDILLKL